MKFLVVVLLLVAVVPAVFPQAFDRPFGRRGGGYGGGFMGGFGGGPGYYYGAQTGCPLFILPQLGQIVSSLYGFSAMNNLPTPTPATAEAFPYSAAFSGTIPGYQPGVGYQAGTTNPFTPACPWPLFNQYISQIATYVSQLETVAGAPNIANNPVAYAGAPLGAGPAPGAAFPGAMRFRRKK